MKTRRPILHATDFSDASKPAFAVAVERAKRERASLRLVHVVSPPLIVPGDAFVPARAYEQMEAAALRGATEKLAALVGRARKAGVHATSVVRIGVPFEEIVQTARRSRADLVIVGTHGRTGLSRLMLGSVAGRVIALAPCPVLTVRARPRTAVRRHTELRPTPITRAS